MEYKGYNGTVVADSDAIIITHSGMAAKAAGLVRDKPRRVPLQAISGVGFKDATRMTNGTITFGVGGHEAPDARNGRTGTDPNAILFRHKDGEAFRNLYEWLLTVVEYNRENKIDPSSVEFDAAEVSRFDRVNASLEEKRVKAEQGVEAVRGDIERFKEAGEGMASPTAPPPQPLGGVAPSPPSAASADDPYEALARLASLRDEGILTEEEFSAMKQEILGSM